MPGVRLIQGDALAVLETLAAGSFDACLCDPPYGISFMGKRWDHGVPSSEVWRAVLRCLRPGASLMAFGGCRTYHRLAVAVEDAGFEIRDSILVPGVVWAHGQGFPKSLDVSKAVDGAARGEFIRRKIAHFRNARRMSRSELGTECGFADGEKTVWDWEEGGHSPSNRNWQLAKSVLGVTEDEEIAFEREVTRESKTPARAGRAITFDQRGSNERERRDLPATPEAAQWEGYGTALKPAWEPVVWAMKPVDGTFARNALEYGVAGLNVDGGRVGTETRVNGPASPSSASRKSRAAIGYRKDDGVGPGSQGGEVSGRFPSNLILAHLPGCRRDGTKRVAGSNATFRNTETGSVKPNAIYGQTNRIEEGEIGYADPDGTEEVAAWQCAEGCPVLAMDRASGELASGDLLPGHKQGGGQGYGYGSGIIRSAYGGDSGTASRFFRQCAWEPGEFEERLLYYAKAATSERMLDGERLLHPTMKPLALATYLARLLLPPPRSDGEPRRLLVPFSGVGSEVIGALRAGWDEVVAIELDADGDGWIEKSARRIVADAPLLNRVEMERSVERPAAEASECPAAGLAEHRGHALRPFDPTEIPSPPSTP